MAKAKRKPAGRTIRGGVDPDVARKERGDSCTRSVSATIEKRRDDKFRLRLGGSLDVAQGQRLLVDADFETVLAVVVDVHPFKLIDVVIRGGLWDQHAHAVRVRRAPV